MLMMNRFFQTKTFSDVQLLLLSGPREFNERADESNDKIVDVNSSINSQHRNEQLVASDQRSNDRDSVFKFIEIRYYLNF